MPERRKYDAQEVLERISAVCIAFGQQAGVGAMETAGAVVGWLSLNPADLEPFMVGGIGELPADFFMRHELTWHAADGRVVQPAEARLAGAIKRTQNQLARTILTTKRPS